MSMAWETVIEDVEAVLRKNKVEKTEEEVEEVFDNLDCDRIENAVLSYTDFEEQCSAAYNEIEKILIEDGIIKK